MPDESRLAAAVYDAVYGRADVFEVIVEVARDALAAGDDGDDARVERDVERLTRLVDALNVK